MKKILYLILATSLFVAGCSNNAVPQKSNLTYGVIKKEIIKNETTQAEVLALFGAPNLITKNRSNDEVWSYNKMSVEKNGSDKSGWLLFVAGGTNKSASTTSSFDFIVIFDKNDIVKDYSVISSKY